MNNELTLSVDGQTARVIMNSSPYRYFITVKVSGSHKKDYLKKHLVPFCLKLSKYSKGHVDVLAGFGEEHGFTHAHLLWLSDMPLDESRAKSLWKKGPEIHFSHKSALKEYNDIKCATDYIEDHHDSYYYSQFCPHPKGCSCSYVSRSE